MVFFFKQKTAYEMRISDWSSDVCSSDLKAALHLEVKTSTVSRYIAQLEADLGIALFNRSTRGLVLTEGGTVFREQVSISIQALEDARHMTASLNMSPQGHLRVTMPVSFGRRHVMPSCSAHV